MPTIGLQAISSKFYEESNAFKLLGPRVNFCTDITLLNMNIWLPTNTGHAPDISRDYEPWPSNRSLKKES